MLLRHIRYFLAVAEQGNFTRAAESLHVSQPTLSQQIRQLEGVLGVQLFDRSARAVRLTEFGTAYARHARAALQQLEAGRRAVHDVENLQSGSLRLAMTPTFSAYLIGWLIDGFNARYPNLKLTIREMPQEQIEPLLADDELDVGIAFDATQSPEIETMPLWIETLALVVGRDHRHARRRKPLSPDEAAGEPLILLSRAFATRGKVDQYFHRNGVTPRVGGRIATVLPSAIAERRDDLCAIRLDPPLPQRTAALLMRKGGYRSAAMRAFVDHMLARRHEIGRREGARARDGVPSDGE
ncbi:transcriptional regulator CynR [Burkholderia pseudomallei]|uniref:transcriptional regulator CynR n=1 Tax=Burkholderia pseudomallei TaxID=28450 RepID=UPI000CDDE062|nr:transcriptional regulator CynR [Burkholderia pseudomallei]